MENRVSKLISLEEDIREILAEDVRARDDDMYLYYLYCVKKYKKLKKHFDVGDFCLIFVDKGFRKELGIRAFSAVERCRRKLQEYNTTLNGKFDTLREDEEKVYEEYSRI